MYLGVTLDRTLSFKKHLENTKAKVTTRNNILRKLVNSKWGAGPPAICATAMALCLSTAEHACSRWSRSRHTKLVDTALNDTCRIITGCGKTPPVPCLYALAGISPPPIGRLGIAQDERRTPETDIRHPLHPRSTPTQAPIQSQFVQTVLPLQTARQAARSNIWEDEWQRNDTRALEWLDRGLTPTESLPSRHDLSWTTWKSLHRLRVERGRCKALMKVWNYTTEDTCSCGSEQTMSHLLECADAPGAVQKTWQNLPLSCGLCRYWQNDI
ncbi:hypothetical protein CesoFtcFv8_001657 [Champsocephalus esox]|uniref:Uncharacterized protein n=1 Tax=Champsocephalus esox TaxID=159716 RepID=A0AAN8D3X0_9TELE|nr:hypothetical protein CesoFtcFv8_001657 [Champsocephalus esox]